MILSYNEDAMHRSPFLAALLSLAVPGAGQLYNGERTKGLAILCIDAGIAIGVACALIGPTAFRSTLTALALAGVYCFIWIPAVIDAYQQAAGIGRPLLSGESRWYVLFMLASVGPGAIPLLWQSPRFSRKAKVALTIIVILLALSLILLTVVVGPMLEKILKDAGAEQSALQQLFTPSP